MDLCRKDVIILNDVAVVFCSDLETAEDLYHRRITRIVTADFPKYFALVTRLRQDITVLGPDGGVMSSTRVPQVQVVFSPGSLTKTIKVGLQVLQIAEL